MRVQILLLVLLAFFIISCESDLPKDILEQSCKSDKPVPINCEKFKTDDYANTIQFVIAEIDKVVINESSYKISGLFNCNLKKSSRTSGFYVLTFKCERDIYAKNISGTLEFDYNFMAKNKHTIISFKRIFGKKDMLLERKPLDDYSEFS